MATPKYFQMFPDIEYALSVNKAGIPKYIKIKDFFHLLVPRGDILREDTLYAPYNIKNGQRPDEVSYDIYGDEQWYWVVLQINNITDYYTQWPLSETELEEFVYNKYGGVVGANQTNHYSTRETFDNDAPPNLVLPGQLKVPEDFSFKYPSTPGSNVELTAPQPYSVSNFEHERLLNEKKSQIYILDPKYIYDFEREVRNYAKKLEPSVSFVDVTKQNRNY